jgi:hypothetical protein
MQQARQVDEGMQCWVEGCKGSAALGVQRSQCWIYAGTDDLSYMQQQQALSKSLCVTYNKNFNCHESLVM